MKNKIWLLQIPIVVLFTWLFYVNEQGIRGELHSRFLSEAVYARLRTISGWFTNRKFEAVGPHAPKNKVVILDIDNFSIEQYGRWPWHRDTTAKLIDTAFAAGAKVVGLDIVMSEPDQRVSDGLREFLKGNNIAPEVADMFETDFEFERLIQKYKDRLVLGYIRNGICRPSMSGHEDCGTSEDAKDPVLPEGYDKFAIQQFRPDPGFHADRTELFTAFRMIPNVEYYNQSAVHAGYCDADPDRDGYIRRTGLVTHIGGKLYPSLALEMARVTLDEEIKATLNDRGMIGDLRFAKSDRKIDVSPLGLMEINFRGPAYTFQYVSAGQIMQEGDEIQMEVNRSLASVSKREVLKDAIVLIGLSAVGVYDMRAFPYDSNTPGVEGHATILDNLLANDMLALGHGGESWTMIIILMMTVGALLFAFATEKLESVPAMLLFVVVMAGLGYTDCMYFFGKQHVNLNTGLLAIEMGMIFSFTLAVKYVMEERNKKFIKGAFAKYVSPAIIDSIMKDPSKLTVGGEKRDLSILFSDIRGFTTFSERMDAKHLAQFLNDYLGIMTDIVFDNEGTLDKYIGDAVMAFWGAPLDQPKHAPNALRAAIKMLQALDANRERFKTQYGVEVNIGIGVNSGAVNVGNMGSERIFEYTVIGDHVNLASRLEGLTKHYGAGIVTSRFTFDYIKTAGEAEPPHRILDFVKVKGKKTAIELIQVLEREYSPEGLQLFEAARQLYLRQQWDAATESFVKAGALLRRNADEADGPTEMYLERIRELKQAPPGADWDGSWEMHSK